MLERVRIQEKFALFSDYWSPKIIDELNDSYIKVAKFKGEFVWHYHDSADELFWIFKGSVTLKLRDRDVVLNEGDMHFH